MECSEKRGSCPENCGQSNIKVDKDALAEHLKVCSKANACHNHCKNCGLNHPLDATNSD